MKELGQGLWALIFASIVTLLIIPVGTIYSFGYSFWLSVTGRKWYAFLQFWWRLIDGFCAALGHLFFELAYAMDLCWNVNGEIIEDVITAKENTHFSQKNISVSATTGKLEIDGNLNKSGMIFSSTLSFFFGQKSHAKDAWNFLQAKNELRNKYFL